MLVYQNAGSRPLYLHWLLERTNPWEDEGTRGSLSHHHLKYIEQVGRHQGPAGSVGRSGSIQ